MPSWFSMAQVIAAIISPNPIIPLPFNLSVPCPFHWPFPISYSLFIFSSLAVAVSVSFLALISDELFFGPYFISFHFHWVWMFAITRSEHMLASDHLSINPGSCHVSHCIISSLSFVKFNVCESLGVVAFAIFAHWTINLSHFAILTEDFNQMVFGHI